MLYYAWMKNYLVIIFKLYVASALYVVVGFLFALLLIAASVGCVPNDIPNDIPMACHWYVIDIPRQI
jgi:hypothetical protein